VVASDALPTHVAASREALSAEPRRRMGTPLEHGPSDVLFAFCPCGALHAPDAVQLAQRPDRPCRVALARGTLAPPGRCAAVHRSGNNSSVLAFPRTMCVITPSRGDSPRFLVETNQISVDKVTTTVTRSHYSENTSKIPKESVL
jgi:hypothetical protein